MSYPLNEFHKRLLQVFKEFNVDPDKNRWELGLPHHPMSKILYKFIDASDWLFYDDFFHWHSGGDGDNGETLMYEMDTIFELWDTNLPDWDNDLLIVFGSTNLDKKRGDKYVTRN